MLLSRDCWSEVIMIRPRNGGTRSFQSSHHVFRLRRSTGSIRHGSQTRYELFSKTQLAHVRFEARQPGVNKFNTKQLIRGQTA